MEITAQQSVRQRFWPRSIVNAKIICLNLTMSPTESWVEGVWHKIQDLGIGGSPWPLKWTAKTKTLGFILIKETEKHFFDR